MVSPDIFRGVIQHRNENRVGGYTHPEYAFSEASVRRTAESPNLLFVDVVYKEPITIRDGWGSTGIIRYDDGTVVGMGCLPVEVREDEWNRSIDGKGYVTTFRIDLSKATVTELMTPEEADAFFHHEASIFYNQLNVTSWGNRL